MQINVGMLRLARQRKGFQQGEAAERLGIAQATLSRIENGLAEAKEDLLDRASVVYGLPKTFFIQPDPVYGAPVSVHPMWRRKADVTMHDMDRIVAELNVRVMHVRRLLDAAELANDLDIPRFDVEEYGDPERIAGLLRAHWKVPSGPLKNLTALVERAGVIVVHSSLGESAVSGVTFAVPGIPPIIALNEEQPSDRLRFSLAHELGHLVMHRFPTPQMEEEANAFAGAFLMPAVDIRPYFVGRRVDLVLLAALKPEWKVAMQSLLMRARSLGMLSKNQERYLWQQISARRIRHREPPELDFPPERPTVINKVFRIHMDTLQYTLADLGQLLHMHENELESLYDLRPRDGARTGPKLKIIK